MKTKLHYVLTIAMLLFVFSSFAQNSSWKHVENIKTNENLSKFHVDKNKLHVFELDLSSFKKSTASATLRGISNKNSNTIVSIPAIDGKMESFKIYETSVFAPELAVKYPNIKSYVGISTDHSGTRLRMSVSPQGVQTMISYISKPTVFMQPIAKGSNTYVLYNKGDRSNLTDRFECKTIDKLNETFNKNNSKTSKVNEGGANDKTLQKFRLAVSTTSEYTTYHDDGNAGNGDEIADALAAINASINRINEIFETDMAITFEVIANTNLVIFNDADTDPYSPASAGADGAWNSEVQNTLTSIIGENNYDIGHLFGATGGGGNAGCIGCVCQNNSKGSAYTSPSNGIPETDTFDIDFVAHEIGHQMGANHTWAYDSEGAGVNSEPGSGTTVMAYAGLEGANNVELNSDDYFHFHSIKQILDNVNTKICQTTEAISNNPPSANAGNNYNIPKGTAYVLKGAATDNDGGDNLTYCWEQIDSGITNYLNFGSDLTSGSTNRSLPPSDSPDRYIPKFSSVISGNTTQTNPTLGSDWETVSTVARNLNWALTVRDRDPLSAAGGQSSYDTMQITVEDVPPFSVTNPVSWAQESMQTITWEVGQTTNVTINCQSVNIKFSTDGGLTFPTIIASNTPNDGSFTYNVPGIPNTNNARILIEAADNIFYDVCDFDFSISTEPDFFIIEETLVPLACAETTAVFNFEYVTANGFSENTFFSASGLPGSSNVAFSPTSLSNSGSVIMTISNLDGVAEGNYPIVITGTSSPSSITKNKNVDLAYFNGLCTSVANTDYDTGTTLVAFNTINKVSSKPSGYSNYTSTSSNVNRDSSYNLTINVNTDGDFTTNTKVWIDWNQNCSFDDAGEAYNLGEITNVTDGATPNSPLSITIPIDALLGHTIMRVSTKYEGDSGGELPIACENGFDGEVEDYALNIMPTLDVEEFGFDNFLVYPNPNKGEFTIKLNGSKLRDIQTKIYDTSGRLISKNTYGATGDFKERINLNNIQSGLYLLIVCDGLRQSTKKIVIE
ncbi:zinc-dependent metalloprotease family protein [Algibacter agarivorans]|uniref:Zinc-dependent metalloprotease family protein n=1 Tax=Algibacter agarivorans TaxID=1109741 RepID=A0ABP9GL35_9FLAO